MDKEGHLRFWGQQSPSTLFREPTVLAAELGLVLDIAATWHSSLNVCRTTSGVYFWGKWLGQGWKCPSASNFPSMDLLFAVDKGVRSDSIMCRPLLMPDEEGSTGRTFSEQLNTAVSIPSNSVLASIQEMGNLTCSIVSYLAHCRCAI